MGNDPSLTVAAIAAVLQAVQTWYAHKDARRAAEVMDKIIGTGKIDPELIQATQYLEATVPIDVLYAVERRIENCWVRYAEILEAPAGKFAEAEIDNATEITKLEICKELSRLRTLGGAIPNGKFSTWWQLYNCSEA